MRTKEAKWTKEEAMRKGWRLTMSNMGAREGGDDSGDGHGGGHDETLHGKLHL